MGNHTQGICQDVTVSPRVRTLARTTVTDGAGALVTRRELADLLTLQPMTVTKWEQLGMPIAKRGRKGRPSLYALPARAESRGPFHPRETLTRSVGDRSGT